MGRFDGRVAVVTGAARGIGFGTATRFAEEGASVAVLDLDEAQAAEAAAERSARPRAVGIGCDVSDAASVEAAVDRVVEGARRAPHPGQQRRHHPRQPAVQDDRRRLGPGDQRPPARRLPDDPGRAEALRGRRSTARSSTSPASPPSATAARPTTPPPRWASRASPAPSASSSARTASTPTRSPPASSPPT